MEIDIVNKLAMSGGFAIDETHYFKLDGTMKGCNVYLYVKPKYTDEFGNPAPSGYPSYVIVSNGTARFLDVNEINKYWEL